MIGEIWLKVFVRKGNEQFRHADAEDLFFVRLGEITLNTRTVPSVIKILADHSNRKIGTIINGQPEIYVSQEEKVQVANLILKKVSAKDMKFENKFDVEALKEAIKFENGDIVLHSIVLCPFGV
eukprot:Trichotokara_eunicae@DN2664_c0_g1_i1.p1